MRDKARVCAECGRHQRWGTLQSANALVALLVALLSVGTLAWDRIYPVMYPDRAVVQIEIRDVPAAETLTFDMTNLSPVLASVPRFAWCRPVAPVRFVQGLAYISSEGYVPLELTADAPRSLGLGDAVVTMRLAQDLFPEAALMPGLKGAFDCAITPSDAHDNVRPLEGFYFRLFFQYVRDIRLVSAREGKPDTFGVSLDPNLFFARAQFFGCGPVNPDPAQPACE
ncbi:MAG: hypothetical protein AAGI09_00265 [Pseudomonadota bacterium]